MEIKRKKGEERHFSATMSLICSLIGFSCWMLPSFGIVLSSLGILLGLLSWRAGYTAYTKHIGGSPGLAGILLGSAGFIVNLLMLSYAPMS